MKRKSIIIICILITITTIGLWMLVSLGVGEPYMGSVAETWETSNQTFKLRVNRHNEMNGGFVPGAYYAYQTVPENSHDWKTIFTQRHDDPNPILRNSVQFVNSQIGYVFFGQKFAVTMDAGKNWTEWDAGEADKILQFKQYSLYPSIEEAHIEPDGHGSLKLYSITDKPVFQPELKTIDYGRNWKLE